MSITTSFTEVPAAANKQTNTGDTLVVPSEVDQAQSAPKEAPLSPQLAAMARKEKAMRAERLKFAEEQRAFETEKARYQSEFIQKSKFKDDPISALLEEGFSVEDIANRLLNQPSPQERKLTDLERKYASLEAKREQDRNDLEAAQKANQERKIESEKKQLRVALDILVNGNEEFECINKMEQQDAVVEYQQSVLETEGYLIPTEDAARDVEAYLEEQALSFARLQKIQSKLQPTQPQALEAQKQPTTQKQQGMNTLSNRTTTASAKPLTDKERIERAILAFQGKLA